MPEQEATTATGEPELVGDGEIFGHVLYPEAAAATPDEPDDAGEPADGATAEAAPETEPKAEPGDKKEPASDEGGETAGEPAAEPEAEAKTAGEPEGEAATEPKDEGADGFDPKAFASEYDLDADLFKNCEDEVAALKIVARTHKHFKKVYGEHTRELGDLRAEKRRLEEMLHAGLAGTAGASADAGNDALVPSRDADGKALTEEEIEMRRDELLARLEREPDKVVAEIREQAVKDALAAVESKLAQRDSIEKQSEIAAEWAEFETKHPDWESRRELMEATVQDVGFYPTYEEQFELARLKIAEPDSYASIVTEMRAGLSFEKAKALAVELPRLREGRAQEAATDVTEKVEERANAERAHGPTGRGNAATAAPDVPLVPYAESPLLGLPLS